MSDTTTATVPKFSVWAPRVPGAEPSVAAECETMGEALAAARRYAARRDLTRQDVTVRVGRDGKRCCFVGPAR